jgi:hypothetical protein
MTGIVETQQGFRVFWRGCLIGVHASFSAAHRELLSISE